MRNSIFTLTYSLCAVLLVLTYLHLETYELLSENHLFQENSDESTEEIDFEEEFIDLFNLLDKNDFLSHFDEIKSSDDFHYFFTIKSNHRALNVPPPRVLFA